MKLNVVILADDSAYCSISDLCLMLKNSAYRLLEQYKNVHPDMDLNYQEFLSDSINKQNLSEKMASVNIDRFLCFWYGHGKRDSFQIDREDVVTTTDNHYVFSNAFIYTFSCLNGNELADILIANKVKAFVGYTEFANCPYGMDDVTCNIVMSFVSSFLFKGKSIKNAVDDLKASYEEAIYNSELDPIQRSEYQKNRDSIVIKGDGNLTINDLLVA